MLYVWEKVAIPNSIEIKSFANAFTLSVKVTERKIDRKRIKHLKLTPVICKITK